MVQFRHHRDQYRREHLDEHEAHSAEPPLQTMPPKVSQLLTRVLAREHDDDGPSSSDSEEDDYGLKQMAANASAGLRMGKQQQQFEGCSLPISGRIGVLLLL